MNNLLDVDSNDVAAFFNGDKLTEPFRSRVVTYIRKNPEFVDLMLELKGVELKELPPPELTQRVIDQVCNM